MDIVIAFNEFDIVEKYLKVELTLRNLIALRNFARFKVSYIFTALRPFSFKSPINQQNVWCLPFVNDDALGAVERNLKRYKVKLNGLTKNKVIQLSGGHAGIIKFIVQAISRNEGKNTENTLNLLSDNSDICFQLQRIIEPLTELEKIKLKTCQKDELLISLGFQTEEKGKINIFSPLLEKYLKNGSCPIKPFCFDKENDKLYFQGKEMSRELTLKESKLLKTLIENEGKIYKRDEIMELVWSDNEVPSDWTLDKLVSRLREKLNDKKQKYIKTSKGVGIYLNNSI